MFRFSNVKKRNKISRVHIFKNSLLRNETKLIKQLNSSFPSWKNQWLFGYNLRISCFVVKEQMAVWIKFSKFCASLKKKRMVVSAHAL